MKISKQDALAWFRFFAELPEDEPLMNYQQEIALAVFAQIEDAVEAENDRLMSEITALQSLKGRTSYVGDINRFPKGCMSCLLGTGLSAIRKTNKCNLNCAFCYDHGVIDTIPPIGEGLWEIGGTRYREKDIPMLLDAYRKPTGISYVYLEPFMEIEKYYGIIRTFHEAGVHQHMYTNGTLCTQEQLKALGQAGLDELRFNLGASGCADRVIEAMHIAKQYISQVGIETPMTREFEAAFAKKKDAVLATGIDFINCAELHLNENNIGNYWGEPMYLCRMGYLSPIFSRRITFKLMKQAIEENWNVVVHDCCNLTKFSRDAHTCAAEGGWFGKSSYGCEFDPIPYEAFLPTLEDESLHFVHEEPLPEGYRPGDISLL